MSRAISPYQVSIGLPRLFGGQWKQSINYSPLYGACTFAARFTGPRAEGAAGVRMLLARGVDIDWKAGPHGQTHLHHAVLENNGDVARVLLLHGADIYCGDETGTSPLDYMRIGRRSHSGGLGELEVFKLLPRGVLEAPVRPHPRPEGRPELGGQRIAPSSAPSSSGRRRNDETTNKPITGGHSPPPPPPRTRQPARVVREQKPVRVRQLQHLPRRPRGPTRRPCAPRRTAAS